MTGHIIAASIYLLASIILFRFLYSLYLKTIVNRHNNINQKLKEESKAYRELVTIEDVKSVLVIPIFIISSFLSLYHNLNNFSDLQILYFIKNVFYYQLAFFLIYVIFKSIINKFKRTSDYIKFGSDIIKSKTKKNNKKDLK